MRVRLSWWFHNVGMILLAISESLQGDRDGPWGPAHIEIEGNQFCNIRLTPDE